MQNKYYTYFFKVKNTNKLKSFYNQNISNNIKEKYKTVIIFNN